MDNIQKIRNELIKNSSKNKIEIMQRFFKTQKGEYGEGDKFISGLSVPKTRKISKKYEEISFLEIEKLLNSNFHEERLLSLFILIKKFQTAKKEKNMTEQKKIFDFYLKNTKNINNWDLVDSSAYKIIGEYLIDKKNKRKILYTLVKSNKKETKWQWLWEKRIAIISTFAFIKNNEFDDTLKLSKILLNEKHDLMHKAVGWMLREVGKRNQNLLKDFIKENYSKMHRTMLRYAIEKFDEKERKEILSKKFN